MSTSHFPDVNVWLALAHRRHSHHERALAWFQSLDADADVLFCQVTQLGLLRLLTTKGAMGNDTLTMRQAWSVHDIFLENSNVLFVSEPAGLERHLRLWTTQQESSPKLWADAYLAAFSVTGQYDLITFDKGLADRVPTSTLLQASFPNA